jgi:DNA-directed RNA polymerase subunit M/transcription elongation factor TFIIS
MKTKLSEVRESAKKTFRIYLNIESNVIKLEKIIFKIVNKKFNTNWLDNYKSHVYEISLLLKNKTKFVDIIYLINNNKLEWGHENFKEISNLITEQNDFIKNPFEIEEGIFQCKAFNKETGTICGSRRVYSYAKQDRSSDEGTSVYAQCMSCGCKWRERG